MFSSQLVWFDVPMESGYSQPKRKKNREKNPEDALMFSNVYHGRKAGFYSDSLFMEHGVSILEDLVIMLADGIASMYLELMSVDSSMSNEMNNVGLSLCTLSTRALQKLRNEVLLLCGYKHFF